MIYDATGQRLRGRVVAGYALTEPCGPLWPVRGKLSHLRVRARTTQMRAKAVIGLGVHGPRHVSDEPRGFEQFAPKFPIRRLRAACFGAQSTSLTAFSSAESARVPSNEFIHQQFQRLK
jgi:hypothetical protein